MRFPIMSDKGAGIRIGSRISRISQYKAFETRSMPFMSNMMRLFYTE
jgi:hypothetical protein